MVEPVDVFEGGVLEVVEVPPWSLFVDEFCLVKADDGFGEGVIVGVAYRADRWFDAGFGETLGVSNGQILPAGVGMMYEAAVRIGGFGVSGPECLLESVEGQVGTKRRRDPPPDDEPRVDIDNEGYVGRHLSGS